MDAERLRALTDWQSLGLPAFNTTLPVASPVEERDLERLQAARGLLTNEPARPKDAMSALKPLLDEGKYDIRALAVLLQAVALERPIVGAATALDTLARLLRESWESIGPLPDERRRKLANLAIPATLDHLRVALTAAAQSGQVEKALDRWPEGREPATWDALCEAVHAAARDRGLDGVLAKIADVRAACQPLVRKPPPPAVATQPDDDDDDDTERLRMARLMPPVAPAEPKPRSSSSSRGPTRVAGSKVTLRASTHFFELLDKLRAFETLLGRNECGKAAIVAADIEQTIARFDARLFFPELFAGFFEGLASRAEELAAYPSELESPSWRALGQLYRVDLESFLRAGGKPRVGGRP
jgi:hypothetical protein